MTKHRVYLLAGLIVILGTLLAIVYANRNPYENTRRVEQESGLALSTQIKGSKVLNESQFISLIQNQIIMRFK